LRLNPYPSHYRTAFAFSDILYPRIHRLSLRLACPCGRIYGLTVFHVNNTGRLGGGSFPGRLCFRLKKCQLQNRFLTFWLLPDSIFGSSKLTEFITTSLMFTLLPSLVPYRVMLAVPLLPHGFGFILSEWATLSEGLQTQPLPATPALLGYCRENDRFI